MVDSNLSSPTEAQGKRVEDWLSQPQVLPPPQTRFAGVDNLSKGLILSCLSQSSNRPCLAVFGSRAEARNAVDNFSYFAGQSANNRVHYLPSLDFDFYRGLLLNPEILCERNVGLFHALNDPKGRLFVTTVGSLLQKIFPADEFLRATGVYSPNDEVDREKMVQSLLEAGYQRQPTAYDPGIFSVRGGVIDVFCPLYAKPVRMEFFGDLIEEIRFFDPASQRSLEKLEKVFLIPVGLSLIPHGEDFEKAAVKVKDRLDHLDIPKARRDEILENIRGGILSTENAYLFPLLSGGSASLTEYFPKDTLWIWDGKENIEAVAEEIEMPKIEKNFALFEAAPSAISHRESLFVEPAELEGWMDSPSAYFFEAFRSPSVPQMEFQNEEVRLAQEREGSGHRPGSHALLEVFSKRFRSWMDQGYRIQIVSHTQTHSDRFSMLFEPYGIKVLKHPEGTGAWPAILNTEFSHLNLWQGYITQSRVFPLLRLVVLSEEEIFGHKKRVSKTSTSWVSKGDSGRVLSSFRDLKVNDYVVHKDFGIGRYLGLKPMNFLGVENDYVLLEYRDNDKLYIPVYRLNVLQKYVGGEGSSAVLDKLGGEAWAKARSKAARAVAELAAEFLNIHAKRKMIPAHAFAPPDSDYRQFEMEFPFDETPDQMKAIEDVMEDLSQSHPMDRLICGDVGYGKTEVAMRAAYRAILDRKQVAVLVPTTVLAFQHFQNFKQRFKSTAARIEMVSRLRTAAETKKVLAAVKEGKVDILIGTHRLLSADVQFQDLGVMVVDEEHRFGVVHKERLKKIAESVHVVSMTATPIPRTLNMAMTGIKDVSIITTPPPDRLSIRTFVCRSSDEVILEAIQNELGREGQVFFVHNRIETIFKVSEDLKRLLPKLKIEIVHGQMEPEILEKKMLGFYSGEFDILLTTAIIESGLDVPRANTIIIDKADHFGLAQLYQLRGRVGRSEQRAYCYLLVPAENQMTEDAKQRLQVIQRYTDLGSGFNIASHDLEIRGAGDLLGRDQSGHLNAIGVDLYLELLEESMRALRGQEKKVDIEPEITLKIAANLPNDYLPDVGEKVLLYRRLSAVENEDQVADLETEIRDRFGTLPVEVTNLLGLMTLKLYLKKLHVTRMSCGPKRTSLQFAPSTPASPEKLVKLVQANPKAYQMTPDQKLVFQVEDTDWRSQLKEVKRLIPLLGGGE